jgi:hypothetical protein
MWRMPTLGSGSKLVLQEEKCQLQGLLGMLT